MFFTFALLFTQVQTENLVKDLGSDSYRVRELAQKKLEETMDFELYLQSRDKEQTDLEIMCRLNKVHREYQKRISLQYKVDLMGYPDWPWLNEGWTEEVHIEWDWFGNRRIVRNRYCPYLREAEKLGAPKGSEPHWLNFRKATQLWAEEFIFQAVGSSMVAAKSEKEFRNLLACQMRILQHKIQSMIDLEDVYWARFGKENPLRVKHAKK
jgi:hypothetical protein